MAAKIRLKCDTILKTVSFEQFGGSPSVWNNSPLDVEFGIFKNGEIQSITEFSSIAIMLKPSTRRGASIKRMEVAAANMLDTLTAVQWDAGVLCHGTASLSAQDMAVDLQVTDKKAFWLAIVGTELADGAEVMLGGTTITIEESGINLEGNQQTQGANRVPPGAVYDVSGNYTLAVTVDMLLSYVQGANDDTLVNGVQTLSADGTFTANGASVTLTGTIGQLVTATVRYPLYLSADQVLALVSANAILATNLPGVTSTFVSPDGTRKVTFGAQNDGNPLIDPQAV